MRSMWSFSLIAFAAYSAIYDTEEKRSGQAMEEGLRQSYRKVVCRSWTTKLHG